MPATRQNGRGRGTALLSQPPAVDEEEDPLAFSPIRKRARASSRLADRAGPSGWKHAEDGDERDLVPPSDDEEYEAWKEVRATQAARTQSSQTSDSLARSFEGGVQETASTVPLSYSHSDATSPTIPLTSDEVGIEDASVLDLQETPRRDMDTEMDYGSAPEELWPKLFSSPRAPSASPNQHGPPGKVDSQPLSMDGPQDGMDDSLDLSPPPDDTTIEFGRDRLDVDDDLNPQDPTDRYALPEDLDLPASPSSPSHHDSPLRSIPPSSHTSTRPDAVIPHSPAAGSRTSLGNPRLSSLASPPAVRSSPRSLDRLSVPQEIEVPSSPVVPLNLGFASPRSSPNLPSASAVTSIPPLRDPSPAPVDPELSRFRSARTFRTRTMLQLQPYTKERQAYEAALKKGGLKKGKRAVAAARDISEGEEDQEDEGDQTSSSDDDPERIVIGETESSPRAKRQRKPVEVLDIDRDEYSLQYGTQANLDDPEDEAKLQDLARARRKAEKIERRKARQAAKARAEFEQMLHGGADPPDESADLPTHRPHQVVRSYARNTVRYPRREVRTETPAADVLYRQNTLALSRRPTSPPSTLPPSHATRDDSEPMADLPDFGWEDQADFGAIAVPEYDDDITITQSQEAGRRTGSPASSSSSGTDEQDPRDRIARRMMPVVMLKRLQREEEKRERKRVDARRRATLHVSPARPGRAVIRRGVGAQIDDFDDIFDREEPPTIPASFTPSPPSPVQGELIVISDDDASDGSQAHEDNGPPQALNRLFEGDFESIVRGDYTHQAKRRPHYTAKKARRQHRPPLGLAKRIRAVDVSPRAPVRSPVQATLGRFLAPLPPSNERLKHILAAKDRSKHRTSHKLTPTIKSPSKKRRRVPRPAIRLDDHVIFSEADFATPAEDNDIQAIPATGNKDAPLDAAIGRARSWANLDRFSVDFDIQPLPSGLYCNEGTLAGNGSLLELIACITDPEQQVERIPVCSSHNIDLAWDMSPSTVSSVVHILFAGLEQQVISAIIASEPASIDSQFLDFLASYIRAHHDDIGEDSASLRASCMLALEECSSKLDGVIFSDKRRSRHYREPLLAVRWSVFRASCLISASDTSPDFGIINTTGRSLLRQLLDWGFDKSMAPLKEILRGDAATGEISDLSVVTWIAAMHTLSAMDESHGTYGTFETILGEAIDSTFKLDRQGPLAAERIWFLTFGLCALSQFDANGRISSIFNPAPRWAMVKRAISLIKISHDEDMEERSHMEQLQGRDRYIKTMIARCVRLSTVWKWSFDRESFSVVTKDLGVIFKERQYRNFPTEPSVDFPAFITNYNMPLTAQQDSKRESAFELFLRLVCVAASDLIGSAESLEAAQQAEKDVQRLILSIIPVSPVKFNRLFPPTARQLGQLINRFAIMTAACFFSPSLLPWLLANSRRWAPFEMADFDSRQICIRGMMYIAVACRHHNTQLQPVVARFAEMLTTLQTELDTTKQGTPSGPHSTKLEVERTMVLVVVCFRQIIQHHTFDPEKVTDPVYPDPCLLDESWSSRVFTLDLVNDTNCGLEVIATIQAYLDARASALPRLALQRREARLESEDEFSFGMDISPGDLAALGDDLAGEADPVQVQDEEFANIITAVISPRIYRLLSDILPSNEDDPVHGTKATQREILIAKLTKCWVDCAQVVVVEHNSPDGWTPYIGSYGKMSWQRLRSEKGRMQVGLQFMLNVAVLDPRAFSRHEDDFLPLILQALVTDRITLEHKFIAAIMRSPGVADNALLAGLDVADGDRLDETRFLEIREAILESIFSAIPGVLSSPYTPGGTKSLIYRCVNLMFSTAVSNLKAIPEDRVIHRETYQAFIKHLGKDIQDLAGEFITPHSVPSFRTLV